MAIPEDQFVPDQYDRTRQINRLIEASEGGRLRPLKPFSFSDLYFDFQVNVAGGMRLIMDKDGSFSIRDIAPRSPAFLEAQAGFYQEKWGIGLEFDRGTQLVTCQSGDSEISFYAGYHSFDPLYHDTTFYPFRYPDLKTNLFPQELSSFIGALMVIPQDLLAKVGQIGIASVKEQDYGRADWRFRVEGVALPGEVFSQLGLSLPLGKDTEASVLYPISPGMQYRLSKKGISIMAFIVKDGPR